MNMHQDQFNTLIATPTFPCVGAKSALQRKQIDYVHAGDMASDLHDENIVSRLQEFAANANSESLFLSIIVLFEDSTILNELQFEKLLWQRLQAFHEIDSQKFDWDETVSSNPESSQFSMSIGAKGFYVVGLHPLASRPARRFSCPALVFNLHSQFELLRKKEVYNKLSESINARDLNINGSVNPMLSQHGHTSEVKQYSGRVVEDNWKCPFHQIKKD